MGNRAGFCWTRPEARRAWPREKRRVESRRNVTRETVQVRGLGGEVVGARRSERVPVRRRARVEVRATMETWVVGEFEVGIGVEVEGG